LLSPAFDAEMSHVPLALLTEITPVLAFTAQPVDAPAACALPWQDAADGNVPAGAVRIDVNPTVTIYVCRVSDGTSTIPGKLVPGWGCYHGDGQSEQLSKSYQVLVPDHCDLSWQPSSNTIFPADAIAAGSDAQGTLYACQVTGDKDPGELGHAGWSTNHTCIYSLGGASLTAATFTVLTSR